MSNYWNELPKKEPPLFQGTQAVMLLVKLIVKLQPLFALSLFVTFIIVFGYPALTTFIKYDVYVKETSLKSEPLPSPAITICMQPVIKT